MQYTTKTLRIRLGLGLSVLGWALILSGCLKTKLEVEYELTRFPNEDFDNISIVGIPRIEGLGAQESAYLALQLRECRQPKPTVYIDSLLDTTWQSDKVLVNSLERSVPSTPMGKKSHGMLVVRVVKDDFQTNFKGSRLIKVKDKESHDWFSGYGRARTNFAGTLELAPEFKTDAYTVDLKKDRYDIRLGYVYYNTRKKAIIHKAEIAGTIKINSYSAEPPIDPAKAKKILIHNLLDQIVYRVCDQTSLIKRTIVATKGKSKVDNLLQEGIQAADKNQWKVAAEKWEQVIKEDPKNVMAHQNLGIYFEKSGNPVKAADHFLKLAQLSKKDHFYDDVIDANFPLVDAKDSEPRVFAVSGGNWVTILGGWNDSLDENKVYSVYRVRRIQDVKTRETSGLDLYQVGRVKIMKGTKPYFYARPIEYLSGFGIEIGDIVYSPKDESPISIKKAGDHK